MKAPLYDTEWPSGDDRRRFSGEPEQIAEDIQTYADLGVTNLIFDVRGSDLKRILERMAWLSEEVMSLT
jgi:alkanesulfonate monooxygenase SsuD/methylene tetrahydromethanopterin reductase-like flavin-dependent oxidoreductase (luciferase family)